MSTCGHIVKCPECFTYLCEDCTKECGWCNGHFCDDCLTNHDCDEWEVAAEN